MSLGILGGTFDPIHHGHLIVAQAVAEQLHLDQVLFVPAGQPWMKQDQTLSPAPHRRAMVELATRSDPGFLLCALELERPGDTYTVDTLEALRAEPGRDDDLFFIIGADALELFPQWKDPERILQLATLAVVPRPGYGDTAVEVVKRAVPGGAGRIVLVNAPLIEVSATGIRQRVAAGLWVRHLVPDAVAEYIEGHGLYQEADARKGGERMAPADTAGMAQEILDEALARGALLYGEFKLSSGEASNFYFDGRLLTLSPRGADLVARALLPWVRAAGADAVGGPTLAADPMVAALAMLSQQDGGKPIPAFIVRKETKEHGAGRLIEGPLPPNAKVAIVDDTCTTGGSLFHAINAAEQAGCSVVLVAAILDRRQGGSDRLREAGYPFQVLLEADAQGRIGPAQAG